MRKRSSSAAPWLVLGGVVAAGVVVYLVTKSSSAAAPPATSNRTTNPSPAGSSLVSSTASVQHVLLTPGTMTVQAAIGDTVSLELPLGASWQNPSAIAVQPGTNAPVVFQYLGPPSTFQMSWRDRIVHTTTTVNLVTA